jgi:hypothetical protein
MLETQLAYYQSSRQAVADPHRDLRLNIDEMSYEVQAQLPFDFSSTCS